MHRQTLRIFPALIFALSLSVLLAPVANAASQQWWTLEASSPLFRSKVRSVDLSTGKAVTWRNGPVNDMRFGYATHITPSGKMMYWQEIGKSKTTTMKIGIYLSDARNSFVRLLATGYTCTGDPCPTTNILTPGSLSDDGRFVSYRKDSSSKILNLSTGRLVPLPWKGKGMVKFSPRSTFAYEWITGEVASTFRMYDLVQRRQRAFRLPASLTAGGNGQLHLAISPDERYAAFGYSSRTYDSNNGGYLNAMSIVLLDLKTGKIVDSERLTKYGNGSFVWSSKRSFVFMRTDREDGETTGPRQTAVRVDVRNGAMTFHDVAQNLDEPGGWNLHEPVEPGKILVERNKNGGSVDSLAILNVQSGSLTDVYEAKNVPTYYFFSLGPKK